MYHDHFVPSRFLPISHGVLTNSYTCSPSCFSSHSSSPITLFLIQNKKKTCLFMYVALIYVFQDLFLLGRSRSSSHPCPPSRLPRIPTTKTAYLPTAARPIPHRSRLSHLPHPHPPGTPRPPRSPRLPQLPLTSYATSMDPRLGKSLRSETSAGGQ